MQLIKNLGVCFLVLVACGRSKDKDERSNGGPEKEKPQLDLKQEECTIDLMPDGEVIFRATDGEDPKSITHVFYRYKDASIGCDQFTDVALNELRLSINVKSKPMDGYLYHVSFGGNKILYTPVGFPVL